MLYIHHNQGFKLEPSTRMNYDPILTMDAMRREKHRPTSSSCASAVIICQANSAPRACFLVCSLFTLHALERIHGRAREPSTRMNYDLILTMDAMRREKGVYFVKLRVCGAICQATPLLELLSWYDSLFTMHDSRAHPWGRESPHRMNYDLFLNMDARRREKRRPTSSSCGLRCSLPSKLRSSSLLSWYDSLFLCML
jgi:hypothetical protein